MILIQQAASIYNMSASSESLLAKIGHGDKSAVSDCLDRYGGLVWSMARRMTSCSEDAEDVVQEIFVSLWRSASTFDPDRSSETTFVAMIARRRIIDFLRRRQAAAAETGPAEVEQLASPSGEPGSQVDLQDEAAAAMEVLDKLPGEQSRAIKLAVFNGLTHQQIADAMNLPLGTIKSHIRRGLIKVRDRLVHTSVTAGGAI